jgi:hypothetical protein
MPTIASLMMRLSIVMDAKRASGAAVVVSIG